MNEAGALPMYPEASQWVSNSMDGRTRQATIKKYVKSMWASGGDGYGELVAKRSE